MTAFREGVDTKLAMVDFTDGFGLWRPGVILPQLKLDLIDLRSTSHAPVTLGMPEDRTRMLGVLYVIEGSSLGARLLFRRAAAIGYSSNFGARHLAAQIARRDWTCRIAEPYRCGRDRQGGGSGAYNVSGCYRRVLQTD